MSNESPLFVLKPWKIGSSWTVINYFKVCWCQEQNNLLQHFLTKVWHPSFLMQRAVSGSWINICFGYGCIFEASLLGWPPSFYLDSLCHEFTPGGEICTTILLRYILIGARIQRHCSVEEVFYNLISLPTIGWWVFGSWTDRGVAQMSGICSVTNRVGLSAIGLTMMLSDCSTMNLKMNKLGPDLIKNVASLGQNSANWISWRSQAISP